MTDEASLPFDAPAPMVIVERTKRSHRHVWDRWTAIGMQWDAGGAVTNVPACRCGAIRDAAKSKRGRSSSRAGKVAERAIAKAYPNARRTGQFGGPDDIVVGTLFIVQSKARTAFPNWMWDELAKLPRTGGRIPTLIVSSRPGSHGPSQPTRRIVIRTFEDDLALHGDKP